MSVETSEPRWAPAPSLPIWRTAIETYTLVFGNLGFLIRAGWLWLLLAAVALTALDWASHRLGLVTDGAGLTWKDLVSSMATSLVQIACLAGLAVQWHRHVLHAGSSAPVLSAAVVAAYGLTAFVLETLVTLFMAVPFVRLSETGGAADAAIATIVALVAGLPVGAYLSCRAMLMLPAIALDRDSSLRTALEATQGNGWRLLLSSLLIFLFQMSVLLSPAIGKWLLLPPQKMGDGAPDTSILQPAAWDLGEALLGSGLDIFYALLAISFLSLAYRELVLKRQAPEMPAVSAHS